MEKLLLRFAARTRVHGNVLLVVEDAIVLNVERWSAIRFYLLQKIRR